MVSVTATPILCGACGETMATALRYGPTKAPTAVMWCRDGCGAEDPPLYRQPAARVPAGYLHLICEHCGEGYDMAPSQAILRRYCSRECFRASQTEKKERRQAWQLGPRHPDYAREAS